MIQFDFTVMIDRPIQEVFAYLTRFEHLPEWQKMITKVTPIDNQPPEAGMEFKVETLVLGRNLEGVVKVTRFDPPNGFSYTTIAGPSDIKADISIKPAGTGSSVGIQVQAQPAGIFKLAENVFKQKMTEQMQQNLQNLKTILENEV